MFSFSCCLLLFNFLKQYWKYAPTSGYVTQDEGRNVMVLKSGQILRQDVLDTAVPDEKYRMSFWAKLVGVESVDVKIVLRMRFSNNTDLVYGPCARKVCLLYERLLRTKLTGSGSWERVVTEDINMFGNYTDWGGNVDFILFEFTAKDMPAWAELRVSNFGKGQMCKSHASFIYHCFTTVPI